MDGGCCRPRRPKSTHIGESRGGYPSLIGDFSLCAQVLFGEALARLLHSVLESFFFEPPRCFCELEVARVRLEDFDHVVGVARCIGVSGDFHTHAKCAFGRAGEKVPYRCGDDEGRDGRPIATSK